jgi:hypothetical protein
MAEAVGDLLVVKGYIEKEIAVLQIRDVYS